MIRLKDRPITPKKLGLPAAKRAKKKLHDLIARSERPKEKDFNSSVWGDKRVKSSLHKFHKGKCCYCERKRDNGAEIDVEHYRPKGEIKEVSKIGYWWLAYEWTNLFMACKKCNGAKLSKFPLLANGVRALKPSSPLNKENPLFPNPENEEVENLFWWRFDPELKMAILLPQDERAFRIIKELDLNSPNLVKQRGSILEGLIDIARSMDKAFIMRQEVEHWSERIFEETKPDNEFASMRRCFFIDRGFRSQVCKD